MHLARSIPYLSKHGIESHVIAIKKEGDAEHLFRERGIQTQSLGITYMIQFPLAIKRARQFIQILQPSIIHTWLTAANVIGRFAARGKGVRTVSSLRVQEKEKKYHLWLEKHTWRLSDRITVNSQSLLDFSQNIIGIPKNKLEIIPNGIHPNDLDIDPEEEKRIKIKWIDANFDSWNQKRNPHILGYLGRLTRQKGIDILLEALNEIKLKGHRFLCLIAGDGPDRASLERMTAQKDLQNQVKFLGVINSRAEFLNLLDIFILPSRWEGFPNVILEALLLKKRIIATDVSGSSEIIKDRQTGRLVPPEDPHCLAEAILDTWNSQESLNWGIRGKEETLKNHHIEQTTKKLSALYKSMEDYPKK